MERVGESVLCVVGGWDGRQHLGTVETAVIGAGGFALQPSLVVAARSCACSAVLGDEMIVAGGWDGEVLDVVEAIGVPRGRVRVLPPLTTPRKNASAVALSGRMIVMGGWDGERTLSSCEYYDGSAWQPFAPLSTPRECAAAAAMGDCIVVCGGFDGLHVVGTCELYSPATGEWRPLALCLDPPRECAAAVALDARRVALLGGWDGHVALRNVDVLDVSTEQLVDLHSPPLREPRNRPAAALVAC